MLIEKKYRNTGVSNWNLDSYASFANRAAQDNVWNHAWIPYGRHNGYTGNYLSLDGRVVSVPSAPSPGGRAIFNKRTWCRE